MAVGSCTAMSNPMKPDAPFRRLFVASRAEDDAQSDGDAGSITELLNDW